MKFLNLSSFETKYAGLIEYLLMIVLILLGVIAAKPTLGPKLSTFMTRIGIASNE